MNNTPVFLIAFQEQDNLGMGYIASTLKQTGFNVKLIDFRLSKEKILQHIKKDNPLLIGFSIIFQYHINEFKALLEYLRSNDIQSHFCAGGHFPSLRWKELMNFMPHLDSISLFEGEYTFTELAKALYNNREWRNIKGLAYKSNGAFIANEYRPLQEELDKLPPPLRPPLKEYAFGKKYATLIAGRGCYYNCVFCSIREFYSKPGGKVKRLRRPEMVVREMMLLHEECGAYVFLFQDDDFPLGKLSNTNWVKSFCQELRMCGLADKILWKINCRPDEVEFGIFKEMKNTGLFLVYLGIESGTDEGLKMMNKHTSVETNMKSIEILNKLNIGFDFGFMLLDPYSTIQSTHENLDFLERFCGDGCSSITFCKMLPYAETEIERRLISENRIKGDIGNKDYDFLDIRLDMFYLLMQDVFSNWIFRNDGLLNLTRWARHFVLAYDGFWGTDREVENIKEDLKMLVASSNTYFINIARDLLDITSNISNEELEDFAFDIKTQVTSKHGDYGKKAVEILNRIESHAKTKGD